MDSVGLVGQQQKPLTSAQVFVLFCKETLDKCLFSKHVVVSITLSEMSEEPHRSDCKQNYFFFFYFPLSLPS